MTWTGVIVLCAFSCGLSFEVEYTEFSTLEGCEQSLELVKEDLRNALSNDQYQYTIEKVECTKE